MTSSLAAQKQAATDSLQKYTAATQVKFCHIQPFSRHNYLQQGTIIQRNMTTGTLALDGWSAVFDLFDPSKTAVGVILFRLKPPAGPRTGGEFLGRAVRPPLPTR